MSEIDAYCIRKPDLAELESVRVLRHMVLDPGRVRPFELTLSNRDHVSSTIHMAAFKGKEIVSTVRLDRLTADEYEVRKMATSPDHRKLGLGGLVLRAGHQELMGIGVSSVCLTARAEAISFYIGLGYALTGEDITHDDSIPNFGMTLELRQNSS